MKGTEPHTIIWYQVEVIADNSGKWAGNELRFNSREEADAYGLDLSMRWTAVREYRVVEKRSK